MSNSVFACYNQKYKKFCNNKVLQDYKNAYRNISEIMQIKSYSKNKEIK